MNEKLQEYFAQKEAQDKAARDQLLIREGLFEKVYMQPGDDPKAFDCTDFSGDSSRQYKKVAIQVTDEEYAQIRRLAEKGVAASAPKDSGPGLIRSLSYAIYGLGGVSGLLLGIAASNTDGGFLLGALSPWLNTLIYGTLVLGLAEIAEQIRTKK